MLRAEKTQVIDDLQVVFTTAAVVVITHYKGLTVPEITDLRRNVRKAGGAFRVTKNRLTRRALVGTPFENAAGMFHGPTAIAWSADPVVAPKVVVEYARRNDKLAIVGGGLGPVLLNAAAVNALAELPSLDALRAGLVGLLQAPAVRLVGVLQAPGAQLARVIAAYAEKSGAEADAAAGRGEAS